MLRVLARKALVGLKQQYKRKVHDAPHADPDGGRVHGGEGADGGTANRADAHTRHTRVCETYIRTYIARLFAATIRLMFGHMNMPAPCYGM